ncbi:hypothetical protein TWF191_010665 [Orbilia oligospora]|uniref:Uncharacterized protein n=1 Tax=Orbilia oligospora TaxID=2813651 RepID=A0A7C8QI00_ORBOL|nr:hypothetical protein TWF191_010665 [Orbilia oligospora]
MSTSKGDKKGALPTTTTHADMQTGDLLGLDGPSGSSSTIPLVPQQDFTPTTSQAGDDDELPPSYDAEGTSLLPHPSHSVPNGATNAIPLEPPPDFTPYIAEHYENPTTGSVTSYDVHLNEDGEALYRFLLTQNMHSPRPQVRMRGTHVEKHHHHRNSTNDQRSSTEHKTIVDFDITMDFQSLILIEPGQQGIIQVVDEDTSAHRYDTKYLATRLHQLIQSTNYAGDIQITFPTTHNKVKIRPANKLTELRYNKAVRWLCYLTFLWIITWPILFFMTKNYNVVRSVWPMSAVDVSGRRRVKMTEDQWFEYWRLAIRRAVLGRRQGKVTEQDLIELAQEAGMPRMPFRTGNQFMDNMLGGAVDFFGAVGDQRRAFGWGRTDTNQWHFRWGQSDNHWD